MIEQQPARLVRFGILAALGLVIILVSSILIRYPTVISSSGTEEWIYLGLFALVMGIYAWFAQFQINSKSPFISSGTGWGLLCGAVWIAEVTLADLWRSPFSWLNNLLYFGTTAGGFLLPFVPGLLVWLRTHRISPGLRAGLLCGMLGGIAIFLFTFLGFSLFLTAGRQDPQTLSEFQKSGLVNLDTFIVGDYLAAMIAHLLIGLITGGILGFLGGALGKAVSKPG